MCRFVCARVKTQYMYGCNDPPSHNLTHFIAYMICVYKSLPMDIQSN